MLLSSEAIVLSKIRYKDKDVIVKCYTKQLGVLSYLVKNAFSKKTKISIAYFQELSLLNIETNFSDKRSLQYIKEISVSTSFETLHTNILKSTVVMFLSEILNQILKEEEPNANLFTFIKTALLIFDKEESFANFHIIFLLEITKYLGFYPDISNSDYNYFNLEEGKFQNNTAKHTIEGENLTLLKQALGIKFDAFSTIKWSKSQRQELLNMILVYFQLHLGDFKKPKSLAVLNQVFS